MVHAEIATWLRAACAWHDSRHLKVARFGDNMRNVAVTEGNKVAAELDLGYAVNGYGVGDLSDSPPSNRCGSEITDRDYDGSYDVVARPLRQHGAKRRSLAMLPGSKSACDAFCRIPVRTPSPILLRICTDWPNSQASPFSG